MPTDSTRPRSSAMYDGEMATGCLRGVRGIRRQCSDRSRPGVRGVPGVLRSVATQCWAGRAGLGEQLLSNGNRTRDWPCGLKPSRLRFEVRQDPPCIEIEIRWVFDLHRAIREEPHHVCREQKQAIVTRPDNVQESVASHVTIVGTISFQYHYASLEKHHYIRPAVVCVLQPLARDVRCRKRPPTEQKDPSGSDVM